MKNKPKFRKEKGVAGLNTYLSIIVMIFVVGLLVAIFTIMGVKMEETVRTSVSGTLINETITLTNGTKVATTPETLGYLSVSLSNVLITNKTDGYKLNTGNYSTSNGYIVGAYNSEFINKQVNVSATYSGYKKSEAGDTINETYQRIGDATDWFGLIILLGAMVVLILLVVIIINSIRQSGMTGEGGA